MEFLKGSHITRNLKIYFQSRYYFFREYLSPSKIKSAKDIPIIINNFNRVTFLVKLINGLEKRGYTNIFILDNNSTYKPLLKYYEICPYEIIRFKKNLGFKALWKSDVSKRFCNDYYIYTDSDVALVDECPDNFIEYLFRMLKQYKYARKIGLSLRLDNLPDCYTNKKNVICWESKFYDKKNKDGLFAAPTDTTFALYRPRVGLSRSRFVEGYRAPFPLQLEHLPWYNNSDNLNEEEKYYISHCKTATAWSSK